MSEQDDHRLIAHLVKVVGVDEEEARLRVSQDADLWILHPERRSVKELEGEAGVEAWREALSYARWLAAMPENVDVGAATTQLLWDLEMRAEEALRRAEQRAEEKEDKVD
jgi:hypothetical protein